MALGRPAFQSPMGAPFRDELEAAHARIELLERAARDRICERCASSLARPRPRPLRRGLIAVALALFALTFGGLMVASFWADVNYSHHVFR